MALFDRSQPRMRYYWHSVVKIWSYFALFPRQSEMCRKSGFFYTPSAFNALINGGLSEFRHNISVKKFEDMFSRFHAIHEGDGWTGQTDGHTTPRHISRAINSVARQNWIVVNQHEIRVGHGSGPSMLGWVGSVWVGLGHEIIRLGWSSYVQCQNIQ